MKRCPECRRDYYDETLLYCLDDGTPLLDGPATADPAEPRTAKMQIPATPSNRGSDAPTRSFDKASPSSQIRRNKLRWTGMGLLAVAGLTGLAYGIYKILLPGTIPGSRPQRTSVNLSMQRLTGDGKTRDAVISPDGKFLAYIRVDGSERSIWLKQIQTNSNIQVVKPGTIRRMNAMAFSPDGNYLYFNAVVADSPPTIYRVSSLGGEPTKVLERAFQIGFAPDGQKISYGRFDFATNSGGIYVANADGSAERKILTRSGTQFIGTKSAWSPDGSLIAVGEGDDAQLPVPHMSVTVLNVETGEEKTLGERWSTMDDMAWHPSGDSIILTSSENSQVADQVWELTYPEGIRRRLTSSQNGHVSVSITSDGRSIVTGELLARSNLWVSPDTKAENAKAITQPNHDTWGLDWTSDGKIVFSSEQTGRPEIWMIDADGSNARQLTNDPAFKGLPVASPDGRYVVYWSSSNSGQLIRIDTTGGNQMPYSNLTSADSPHISPDSKWVIYSAWSGGLERIFRIPIDGGEAQMLTQMSVRATQPRYSNDGSRFACFVVNPEVANFDTLAIFPAEGGEPLQQFKLPPDVNIDRGPVWMPDDKGITLIVAPGELQNLWIQPLDGTPAKALTNLPVPGIARRAYSRDGKRIALVRGQGEGNAIMITTYR